MKETILSNSSNVGVVKYDEDTKTLLVYFRRGGVYEYYNVPDEVYEEFIHSPSAGQYVFNKLRKDYESKRLDTPIKIHK